MASTSRLSEEFAALLRPCMASLVSDSKYGNNPCFNTLYFGEFYPLFVIRKYFPRDFFGVEPLEEDELSNPQLMPSLPNSVVITRLWPKLESMWNIATYKGTIEEIHAAIHLMRNVRKINWV